ncbi:MAG: class I SAM-dependent methyltransferase [Deltaproteobacteria bacterium]|nr:class I SAM-dependent methyltransferase [Deltaproteobacteria bacterium]
MRWRSTGNSSTPWSGSRRQMAENNEFAGRFKKAIERNFDESAGIYDAFEEKHHLFSTLTNRLCELIAPNEPERILDVGCGTGISTLALYNAYPKSPIIYAIDLSEAMLVRARERCKGHSGIYFVRGDAEQLSSYFHEKFDAVFYTASIFLIPRFSESIAQACGLIIPGGVLAISFYTGIFDDSREDAINRVFPDMKYQYGAVAFPELMECLDAQKSYKGTEVDFHFEINREFLFDFLSIPAQSAGLFPKVPYIQRIPLVREFCDKLAGEVSPLFMGWKFVISRKR